MTLLLSEEDVVASLDMRSTIDALEVGFRSLAVGEAVNRPRSHTYTRRSPSTNYLFKTMDGSIPSFGVHALRISSDMVEEVGERRNKIPAAPGNRFVGLIMLFDIDELVPLAIMPDGALQRTRVGATSALAARHMARTEARTVGIIGSGWQAMTQLEGLVVERSVTSALVYSPTAAHLDQFCAKASQQFNIDVTGGGSAQDVIDQSDIVALATNSMSPVIDGSWLRPGLHIGSVQGYELDQSTLQRADVIGVRSEHPATHHFAPGQAPKEARQEPQLDPAVGAKMATLGDIIMGRSGRTSDDQVTLFVGSHVGASAGLGVQFAAAAVAVFRKAQLSGLGRELPTEWFTQLGKP
ncbi:MAG: ornithine cyclodeaminase family protein [Acidimicrobiia bacterium]|nr:ornithine cyclodeaminase family protein [Acidimicrobiia bacterium]